MLQIKIAFVFKTKMLKVNRLSLRNGCVEFAFILTMKGTLLSLFAVKFE